MLTTFEEVEGGVVIDAPPDTADDLLRDSGIDPPLGVLTRPYKLHSFLVNGAAPSFYYYPWNTLLTLPRVEEVLRNYAYMRADVRIRLLLNCPITTYGTIAAVPLFGNNEASLTVRESLLSQLLSYPGTILADCSTRESIEMVIPYVSLFDNYPIHRGFNMWNGIFIHGLGIYSMLPDDAAPGVQIEMYANFENVVLNGPQTFVDAADGHMHLDPARRLTAAGVIATVATTMGFSQVGSLIGLAGEAASAMGSTSNIHRISDDNTGMDNNPTPIRLLPWGNVLSNNYTDTQQYMAPARYNSAPKQPLNGPNHSFNFYDLIKIPAYMGNNPFAAGSSFAYTLSPDDTRGYFRDIVKLFRRYRGSYKLMLRFVCSPLTVARFNISFGWGTVEGNDTVGDMYSFVISVQGTRTELFQIPYLSSQHWIQSQDVIPFNDVPYIYITCTNADSASNIGNAVPSVDLHVWMAAGDDFVMQHPQSPFYAEGGGALAEGHSNLTHIFRAETFQPVTGIKMTAIDPRDVEDLHEYFNRYSSAEPGLYLPTVHFIPPEYYELQESSPTEYTGALDWLSWYFGVYTSGGRRYKVPIDADVDMVLQNSYSLYNIGPVSQNIEFEPTDGILRTYQNLQKITEFEVPFICPFGMYPVYRASYPPSSEFTHAVTFNLPAVQIASVVDNPPENSAILVAAGHDYQLHILQPATSSGLQVRLIPPAVVTKLPPRPLNSFEHKGLGKRK